MNCATAPWKTAIIYAEGPPLFFKEKLNNREVRRHTPPGKFF